MKKLFFLFFLASCATPNTNYNVKNELNVFNKELNFDEFKKMLIIYAETAPYPNIN
mgnify:CR=1 FL=1|jgi:hypothetical protein|tara:strand:- start:94 stop:261 length:168 start_codon:yes stop_codon:yes gene_type:complete